MNVYQTIFGLLVATPALAPLAPHQPRPARDAAHAMERGGVVRGPGRVQAGTGAAERDPTRGLVQLVRGEAAPRKEAPEGQAGTTSVTRDATARATGHSPCRTAARPKRKRDAECACLHPYADHRLEHSQIGVRDVPVRRLHAT